MYRGTRLGMSIVGALMVLGPVFSGQEGGEDPLVDHPLYTHWANCKPGSTVTLTEKTIFSGAEKAQVPDGIDDKVITRTLLSVSPKSVTVSMVVSERDFLGMIESAPTKMTYAAKIKKSHLQAGLHNINATPAEETIKVQGKEILCKTLAGTEKKQDGTTLVHKIWYSDAVPGGVVKRTQVTSQDGKVVADTTIMVKSFKRVE